MSEELFAAETIAARRETRLAPILMRRDEVINLKMAVHVTGRSEKTIRHWCRDFAIGVQPCPGSPLEISAPALEMVRHGDIIALDLLRRGERNHPRVRRVFDHLGLQP